jgi:hypothetical protein
MSYVLIWHILKIIVDCFLVRFLKKNSNIYEPILIVFLNYRSFWALFFGFPTISIYIYIGLGN